MKEIKLTQGKVAIVDDEDYEWLNQWKWCVNNYGYAVRSYLDADKNRVVVLMHRKILGLQKGDKRCGDHINGNRIDNRKINLRVCTKAENTRNQNLHVDSTSGYKGVSFDKSRNQWSSFVTVSGKSKIIGRFSTPEDAYKAYCDSATKINGEFTNLGNGCIFGDGNE